MGLTKHTKSIYDSAGVISGRSLTRSKAPGRLHAIDQEPLYAGSGSGATIEGTDWRRYIDMICALGAISLGYGSGDSWTRCLTAAAEAIRDGWCLSLPSPLESVAAKKVVEVMAPWASSVRFVKTGSEATSAAYLIARKATGRTKFLMRRGSYHGWHSWIQDHAILYDHREGSWIEDTTEVAAVFVEPNRFEPISADWLQKIRAWCDRYGALLVFDDMIYGLRAHLQGSYGYFGVQPDLACFGKAMGNGAPIACVVGNDALAEHGEIISGTYSGDTVALAAVMDVLQVYAHEPVIETLWARGQQLRDRITCVLSRTGWADRAVLEGTILPHQRLRFLADTVEDPIIGRQFAGLMAERGVLWHPSLINVSYAHSREQIEQVCEAVESSLKAMTT